MTIVRDASVYRILQNNLAYNSTRLNDLYIKASSGTEVTKASDAPSSVRLIISSRSGVNETSRYIESCEEVQDSLSNTEVYIDSVLEIMERAKEIGVAAANDALSDDDRETFRTELAEMKEALVDIANTQVDNKYIFAGYTDNSQPFSGTPVTYSGTTDHQMIEISPSMKVAKNVTGDELFMSPVDLFATLDDLDTALSSDDVSLISDQLEPLELAAEQVRTVQGNVGIDMARIDDIITMQTNLNLSLEEKLSGEQDADLTQVLSEITKLELSLEATMEVTGRVSALNLFNYL